MSESNKPVKVFRLKGVKASVFANVTKSEGREVVFHKATIQKIYHDGKEFKTTQSLGRDDLPVANLLLQRAYEFILEAEVTKDGEDKS